MDTVSLQKVHADTLQDKTRPANLIALVSQLKVVREIDSVAYCSIAFNRTLDHTITKLWISWLVSNKFVSQYLR